MIFPVHKHMVGVVLIDQDDLGIAGLHPFQGVVLNPDHSRAGTPQIFFPGEIHAMADHVLVNGSVRSVRQFLQGKMVGCKNGPGCGGRNKSRGFSFFKHGFIQAGGPVKNPEQVALSHQGVFIQTG
jgi:hypothetical protein